MTEHEALLAVRVGRGGIGVAAGTGEDGEPVVLLKAGDWIVSMPPDVADRLALAIHDEAELARLGAGIRRRTDA